jgi:hypothetical protein
MDVTLIVDGANVMGSRADGWWRDRAGAMARLHGELAALATRGIRGPVPGDSAVPGDTADASAEPGPLGGAPERGPAGAPEPGAASSPEPGAASSSELGVGGAPEPGAAGAPEPGVGGAPGAGQDDADGRWRPQIVLVVEGRTRKVLSLVSPAPGVQVVAARGEGDDEIADLAGRLPGQRVVVTADRELRRRVTSAGAAVTGPGWLLRQFR